MPLYVGDKTAQLSFSDEVQKRAEETGFEFIGIYVQDFPAELKTVCKPGYAEKIINHPGLLDFVTYEAAKRGESERSFFLSDTLTNMIMNSWMPKD